MRRGVGFSWVIGGLLLGCSGGGAAESTGGTTSGSSGATGTGAVGTSTSDVAPTTGAAETGVGATDVDCPAPLERCEGACVDVLHDPQYCGGCGLGCPKELVCVEGQ